MYLFIILIATELLTPAVIWQRFRSKSKPLFYLALLIHIALSIWLWILFIEIKIYSGPFDSPDNVWNLMLLTGMASAVTLPRTILILAHFVGKFLRRKTGGYINWLTNTGVVISSAIFIIIAAGTLFGRFNVKVDNVEIGIKGLHDDIDGLKIAQISDLHLASFYHHKKELSVMMDRINDLAPDLFINTGDFVSYGWREFDGFDTILSKANGRYGSFAVLGNHDFGIYHPHFTEADREDNTLRIEQMARSSGYVVLNDGHTVITIGNAKIGIIGVSTIGRHPNIYHGDIDSAMHGLDSVDLKLALSHDPNHYTLSIEGKTDIDITLSGHTHGMQMGIMTKSFKWSPSKYLYPHWNGLFSNNGQHHYVNRGLGSLAIPFRIWMPPEITLITLRKE